MKHFLSIEIPKLFCYNTNTFAGMVELADTQDLGSCGQPCRFKSCYPHQKNSSYFCTGCFFITRLEPEKVSAFGKCAGGTFLAGSARAVPHAKRGVTRADSMRAQRSRRSSPVTRTKKTVRAFARAVFYIEQHKCECKFTFERKLANKKPKICSFSKLDFGFYSPTIMFTQRY